MTLDKRLQSKKHAKYLLVRHLDGNYGIVTLNYQMCRLYIKGGRTRARVNSLKTLLHLRDISVVDHGWVSQPAEVLATASSIPVIQGEVWLRAIADRKVTREQIVDMRGFKGEKGLVERIHTELLAFFDSGVTEVEVVPATDYM